MKRNFQLQTLTVCVAAYMLFFSGETSGQGQGLLNQVNVFDAGSLKEISEVLAFNAFEPNPKNGTIKFVFEFEDIEHNTGISPTLIVNRDRDRIAHLRPDVFFDETGVMRKNPYNMIEFDLAPEFVSESALLIQFFPNTDKLVTYKVGLLAATVLTSKDEVAAKTPIGDLLNSLESRESSTEQDAAGQPATRSKSK